jgi:hypothetical protein
MSVCCECCVLSGRGLCDELIACPQESYRLWCVVVYDLETSWMRRPWPTEGCHARNKQCYNSAIQRWTLKLLTYLSVCKYSFEKYAEILWHSLFVVSC